ncbi:hypothetical protein HN873_053620 [Arachis hypogaea]
MVLVPYDLVKVQVQGGAANDDDNDDLRKDDVKVEKFSGKDGIRRSNLLPKQVISITLSLGFVTQLWVDTTAWMVLFVEMRPNLLSGNADNFLLEDISQVGDVVFVPDESMIDNEFKMVGLETLVGYKVVTPSQRNIGKVRGYTFSLNSGAVEELELDSFGLSIIPSSLVSTYSLLVEDVLEVVSDAVVVRKAATSRIQRLSKNVGVSMDDLEDYDSEPSVTYGRVSRRRKSRTPLQPKNNSPADLRPKPKPKPESEPLCEITPVRDKENRTIAITAAAEATLPPHTAAALAPVEVQLPEASSLAEELSAIKKKLERMRIDKEKTKTALKEKDAKLDAMMKELEDRGELQKKFEIEVDRLFRLKELKYRCMRVSPMRTLGEKEHGKIVNEAAPSSQSQSQSEEKSKNEETTSFECESESVKRRVPVRLVHKLILTHTKNHNHNSSLWFIFVCIAICGVLSDFKKENSS